MRRVLLVVWLFLVGPAPVWAGMPTVTLTDLAAMRLQAISFFLVVFLLSAWLIRLLWNYLGKDFTSLPRLTYPRALGLVCLWGLLFILVLTMISGARELMTPGAWEKTGLTYKVKQPVQEKSYPSATDPMLEQRKKRLGELRTALWSYAEQHNGNFPPNRDVKEIPPRVWEVPDLGRLRYLYVAGRKPDRGSEVLAYEPGIYGVDRLVLLSNGDIRQLSLEQIQALLAETQ